jgi:peptidoglycan/LPS O-acetylase OafA/YrhL
MKKLQVIIGIIIFVSVFLPWASVNFGFGFKETAVGTDHSSGILVLIMGLGCAALAFLANPKFRRLGQLATGVIALIGVAIYWSAATGELRGLGVPVSPGPGFIICIIAAAVAVIFAIPRLAARPAGEEASAVAQTTDVACPSCGALNAAAAKFCPSCGAELRGTQPKA